MFPELQKKIDDARKRQDPAVRTLMGKLSKAISAQDQGNVDRANSIVIEALKTH